MCYYGLLLIAILIVWVYPGAYFYPVYLYSIWYPWDPGDPTFCGILSAILFSDFEEATHGRKSVPIPMCG